MIKRDEMDKLFIELIEGQKKVMLKLAKDIIPRITEEDLLQPFDYPELERFAPFRYEEGVLVGILMARTALLASDISSG